MTRSSTYRPALDGVRAVAVVAVLLYHGNVAWTPGGFLGVDVFFVLSGYLITSLLLGEHRRWGSIDLLGFYVRRARRLLPALFLVTAAIAVWAYLEEPADKLGAVRADGLSSLLYVANWRFVMVKQSYFDQFGQPSPFRHTWSLAIEEQYYLLFPLLLLGLLALSRRRSWVIPAALGLLAAGSALEMAWLFEPGGDPSRIYYGTDTRIQELFVGSLLATVMSSRRVRAVHPRLAAGVAVLALLGVLAGIGLIGDQDEVMYRGGFLAFCVVVAVMLAGLELAPRGPVARLFSLPPVVWVGAVSYGLYLWHWPLYVALTPDSTGVDGVGLLGVRLAATVALATLSYYLVERPVRNGRLRTLPAWLGRGITAVALPLAAGVLVAATAGAVAPPLQGSPFGPGAVSGSKESLLVVGDSVGASLAQGFPGEDYPEWVIQAANTLGCGLGPHTLSFDGKRGAPNALCDEVFDKWAGAVKVADPQAVLLSIGAWEVFDHVVGNEVEKPGSPEYATYLSGMLERAHDVLTADGARLFVPNVPCYRQESLALQGVDVGPIRNDPVRAAAVNDVIDAFVERHLDDTTMIDVSSWLCPEGTYHEERDGVQMREDGVHYTPEGARLVWDQVLMPVITRDVPTPTRALLVGDSVPLGLYERFPQADHPDLRVSDTTLLGCSSFAVPSEVEGVPLHFDEKCVEWESDIPKVIDTFGPDVGLVFAGVGEQFDKVVDGDVLRFGTPAHRDWLTGALRERIELFRDRGVPVVLPTVPCHEVANAGLSNVAQVINDDRRVQALNDVIEEVAADYRHTKGPRVRLVDLYAGLCADGYTDTLDGVRLHEDGLHFTDDGARVVWDLLAPVVEKLAPSTKPQD